MDLIQAKSEAKRMDDILSGGLDIEILVRLPVSSLLRFKRVCKSWRSLISSPFFIQKHLQVCNSTTTNPNLIFKSKMEVGDTVFVVSHLTLQVIKARNVPPIRHNWWPRILGTYNGLICLYCTVDYRDAAVWNPATGEKKDLPCPLILKSHIRAAGFGFDANNNDYKMVLIHLFIDVADNVRLPGGFQLEYYSLKANSWKLVNEIQGMDLLFDDGTLGAYTNGMISWLAYTVEEEEEEDYRRDEIISFDLSNEVIIRTPLPDNIGSHAAEQSVNHVRVLNESFAVVSDNFHKFEFDIWVLREVGVVESWTKLFTVGPLPHSVSDPLVIWKEGVVFWNKKDKELILYDSANQPKRCVGIPKKQYDLMDAVIYRESLVPLSTEGTT
ncbi:F-box/kelch-repeat protein At3g23880-like [Ziziphus jujuba]|uniref:F-box/kelch-repeat protein At3g23880-like n=1 Tax=Ziziphus jujuba TaxID=326968 RepID=A0ABM3ZU21_ZIZJJ|nr:F-box/kelch-repeat protein At3g23880-like [Ziziphus jujuba]